MTQGQHRATARVLDILESLSGSEEGLTRNGIVTRPWMPRRAACFPSYIRWRSGATSGRTMGRAGILWVPGRSGAGSGLLGGPGALAPITQVMKEVADPTCQETCQMGILGPRQVCCMWRGQDSRPAHPADLLGGDTALPANATAVGKALLSGLTNEAGAGAVCRGPAPADRADHHGCGDPAGPVGGGPARGTGYGAGGVHGPAGLLGRAAAAEGNGVRGSQHLRTAVPLPGQRRIELVRRSLLSWPRADRKAQAETRNFGLSEN